MKEKLSKYLKDYLGMTAGSALFANAISLFIDPNNLAPGGTAGISIILGHLLKVQTVTIIFSDDGPSFFI